MRDTSSSFWDMPSGRVESRTTPLSNPTAIPMISASSREDGIMHKDSTTSKLINLEVQRNKVISKICYIVEQYFGLSHLHDRVKRAKFTL